MKPTSELFDLIKSLTPSEKRYFKLNVSLQKGNKNYLKLFNALDSQKVFNEEEIKSKYKKENFIKNLTFTKNYLYKLIFKSLNSYTNDKTVESKLNNILSRCRFLFNKALYREYFKTVKAGKEIAGKYEMFGYMLDFLEIERQLTKKEDLNKISMNKIYDEELSILDKIKDINEYKRTVSYLLKLYQAEGAVRSIAVDEKVNSVLAGDKFKNDKQPLSLIAKERFYFAMNLIYKIKGNPVKSYEYNYQRFLLISKNKKIFQKFIFDNYQESFLTLVSSAAAAGKFKKADMFYEKYNKLFFKPSGKNTESLVTLYELRLLQLVNENIRKLQSGFIPSLEKILIQYKDKLIIETYNSIYFNLSVYFFSAENFEESLRFINILFDTRYLKYTPNLEPYVRILNILIHYELKNYKLLSHLIPASLKFLKSKNKLFKTEKTTLDFLIKIIRINDHKLIKNSFTELGLEFERLKKDKYEKNAFLYFDFSKWVNKKINLLNI